MERGFWLGDAFASGGSAGYDHKKMGITARGGWECVKRHFREIGVDTQSQAFTVAGIGDMSGDVFGNGMLLSREIRLVAAFNHQHVFLDPAPDPGRSFAERARLFALPRSGWSDYDKRALSRGGGVFERSAKSITLPGEARALLGIETAAATPNEIIRAILRLPVDLLWNGGIGTYVKAAFPHVSERQELVHQLRARVAPTAQVRRSDQQVILLAELVLAALAINLGCRGQPQDPDQCRRGARSPAPYRSRPAVRAAHRRSRRSGAAQ